MKPKVLVIVGPTASGKSALAVKLAKKLHGEIVSADSRQVYKGLDVGTGKITKKEMQGVPHYLLDVALLKKQFSAAEYKKLALDKIKRIITKNKLPIIVGGTGFYIDSLRMTLPDVPPNPELRKKLEKKTTEELYKMLSKRDIDRHNKVRLIRAIEIKKALGKIPEQKENTEYNFVWIGLKPRDLDARIRKRLIKRIPGILRETKRLTSKRAHELGLEYRFASLYLQKKLTKEEFIERLYIAIRQYAKRQMTWFKRNKKIKWSSSAGDAALATRKLLVLRKQRQ